MALIGIRPSVGGLYFDAILKTDHTSKITATDHPVESGANITDHAYVEPDEISVEIGVSDSAIEAGSFGTGARSITAFQALRKLQQSRQPFTVVTRLHTYKNMLISSISAPDDFSTMNALKAVIMMREIIIVSTQTVTVSARASAEPQKTSTTNSGAKQPDSTSSSSQSILKQAATQLGL
ncbi:hypothetical protein LJC32_07145 [Oscillospiraceae bacterium OttesenSCG-928-F05]|nr:hypothetical protein [Oscillospiraceae bacterium OttesenSCG-928-F05]